MAIDARRALREGADDLASTRGAVLYVVFALFAVVSLPVHQTLTQELNEFIVETGAVPPDQFVVPPTPLALDLAVPILVGALAVVFLVGELLRLVAVRSFASDSTGAIPVDEVTDRLGPTLVVLLVVGLLVQVLVYGGLAVFVLPGAIAAVLVLFVRQAVLLDGDGVLDAFRTSISIVTGNVAQVLLLLVTLLVLSFLVGIPTILLDTETVARPVAGAILGTVVTVYSVAVITRAYQHADEEDEVGDADAENDDENDEDPSPGDRFEETADR